MRRAWIIGIVVALLMPMRCAAQWRVGMSAGTDYNFYTIDKHYLLDYRYLGEWGFTVGVKNNTPVYCYIPSMATFDIDADGNTIQLEGIGITPNIIVELDPDLKKNQGRDTQLERALQFIRTGN